MPTVLLAALALGLATTQDAIELREGLALRGVTRSGRMPHFADALLAQTSAGAWKTPSTGDKVGERAWESLKAGEDGSIPGSAIQGGYAYFEVERPSEEIRVLEASGWGMAYVNGEPRVGDPYGNGYVKLPVLLNKGKTSFLFTSGRGNPRARLTLPPAPSFLNLGDPTFPDLVEGRVEPVWGGVVVVNATNEWARDLRLKCRVGDSPAAEVVVPLIAPLSFRKAPFRIESPAGLTAGEVPISLTLANPTRMLDFQKSSLRVRTEKQTRKVTFFSKVDGSLQYYAVNPAQAPGDGKALVLTLHGAGVEAIGQADAYQGKDWCHIVAATNRRPFGFDWEDIGRLDMLEVLEHAQATLRTDPLQTYLTGHSMGGHGTWINGYLFPDKWAAIAPAAGWISFFTYAGGQRAEGGGTVHEALRAASNASETLLWIANSLHYPVYIHHGDKDDNVPVTQAREMKGHLDKIGHTRVTLNEVPGAGHWFGGESVDWPGIFELFKSTKRTPNESKGEIDFVTANLAASSKGWWLQIVQQERAMEPSRAHFTRGATRLSGTTINVEAIRFEPEGFPKGVNPRVIQIDGQTISIPNALEPGPAVLLKRIQGTWTASASRLEDQKRPEQMGPFKEVFKNGVLFVYGTKGSDEETRQNLIKARYDAEVLSYRGNGSVRIVSDAEYMQELDDEAGKVFIRKPDVPNVLLFGSEDTNAAWSRLLGSSPIRVRRGAVQVGPQVWKGKDLCAVFVRPRKGDDTALVGVAASTGAAGQRVLERLPFFTSGAHFPDWTVYSTEMLTKGVSGIRAAGFFRNDWGVAASSLPK